MAAFFTFTLKSSYDDLDISVLAVEPETRPLAVLQLAHGMRGHKERFIPFMEYMASRGVICVANDHRGHGASVHSREDMGYMYEGGWRALVDDMKTVSDWAMEKYAGLPLYLLGHSMGALAAHVYAYDYGSSLSGLILCGNPSRDRMSGAAYALTDLLCRLHLDRMRLSFLQEMTSRRYNRRFAAEGRHAWTCSDPAVRRSFAEDPLCSFALTANGCRCLLGLMREAYAPHDSVSSADLTVLFLSGSADPCMISEQKFHRSAMQMHKTGFRDVSSVIYPGMRHEILNEIGKEKVWQEIVDMVSTPLP